ncbi:hypothetical protein F4859DRAFT_497432 [Xylaria cf. heliscus]|nr:hypothetical protein F4859DRAFT_497432 [Xylaria cf. heliscus]
MQVYRRYQPFLSTSTQRRASPCDWLRYTASAWTKPFNILVSRHALLREHFVSTADRPWETAYCLIFSTLHIGSIYVSPKTAIHPFSDAICLYETMKLKPSLFKAAFRLGNVVLGKLVDKDKISTLDKAGGILTVWLSEESFAGIVIAVGSRL